MPDPFLLLVLGSRCDDLGFVLAALLVLVMKRDPAPLEGALSLRLLLFLPGAPLAPLGVEEGLFRNELFEEGALFSGCPILLLVVGGASFGPEGCAAFGTTESFTCLVASHAVEENG